MRLMRTIIALAVCHLAVWLVGCGLRVTPPVASVLRAHSRNDLVALDGRSALTLELHGIAESDLEGVAKIRNVTEIVMTGPSSFGSLAYSTMMRLPDLLAIIVGRDVAVKTDQLVLIPKRSIGRKLLGLYVMDCRALTRHQVFELAKAASNQEIHSLTLSGGGKEINEWAVEAFILLGAENRVTSLHLSSSAGALQPRTAELVRESSALPRLVWER